MRKLLWMLLVPALLSPTVALALGLGEIRLHSALNEPLDAEARLLSASEGDVSSMEVRLASYETFAKFGVDRPGVLMYLDFQVEERPRGGYRIHITSEEPIREPFLDFIIEVTWGSGRLLREYTLLLDPPEMTEEAPPRVDAPAAAVESAPEPESAPTPEPATAAAETSGALEYGPVGSDDTLWSIAQELRPAGADASIPQVMMALLEANPDAFFDNNVNRLKEGSILRLEDRSQLDAMSRAEAQQALREQTRAWRDFKARAADEAERRRPAEEAPADQAAAAAEEEGRLELVAPEAEKEAEVGTSGAQTGAEEEAVAEPEAAEEDGAAADQAEELERLREELMRARETAEAQRQENEELRGRMEELEGQLASIQRLLTLQNQELAKLQRQMGQEPATVAPEAEPEAEPKPQPKPRPERRVSPAPAPEPAAPSVFGFASDLVRNPIVAGALAIIGLSVLALIILIIRRRRGGDQESILTGDTSSMLRSKEREGGPASEETSLPSDLAISGMENIRADESEVDPLTEADVYMAYGRNRQAEDLLKKAIRQEPDRQELRAKLQELYYKTGDKAAFIAAAEQAHELTEGSGTIWERIQAMGHELAPEHPLFAEAPEGVSPADAGASSEATDEVMDIGLDLDALAAEMEPSEEEAAAAGEEFGALDLELPDIDEGLAGAAGREEAERAGGDDGGDEEPPDLATFDLGPLTEEAEEAPSDETPAAPAEAGEEPGEETEVGFLTDFELPEENAGGAEAPAEPAAEAEEATADEMGLDFDLSGFELPGDEVEEERPAATGGDAGDNALDFDLSGFELPDEGAAEGSAEAGEPAEFDLGDLGDLELPEEGAVEEQEFGPGADEAPETGEEADEHADEEALFGELDEVATKLDLARAYADMGDPESARSMLEEVVQEGDDSQRQQANELLQKLD